MRSRAIALIATGFLLVAGCPTTERPMPSGGTIERTSEAPQSVAATVVAHTIAGGCGSTQAFEGPGPDSSDQNLPGNPWASASPPEPRITAYFWRRAPFVAAGSVNPDGGSNKILWIADGGPAEDLVIAAHPLGAVSPTVRFRFPGVRSYPSLVDLPTPGCWQLDLAIGSSRAAIDLLVGPSPLT